jgi:glucuronokinase
MYLAYRTALSEGTEVFHSNIKERWQRGDPEIIDAMQTWASYAERGRAALLNRNYDELSELINANFDLRARLYQISEGNLEMIHLARSTGASANFAGSGGAITGVYTGEEMFQQLVAVMKPHKIAVVKPVILPRR